MEDQLSTKQTEELMAAICSLRSPDECRAFFRDLCTLSEIQAMTERFEVAKLVSDGVSYRDAAKRAGSSTATVTRVAHWVHHGMGGYKLALERMK